MLSGILVCSILPDNKKFGETQNLPLILRIHIPKLIKK